MQSVDWHSESYRIFELLNGLSFYCNEGVPISTDKGFTLWRDVTIKLRDSKQVCFLIGNGASASLASHVSADLAKNAHIHTQVFTDLSLITAISNDIGYERVFAEPLSRQGNSGDMLVAVSSSGRSKNILAAVDVARSLKMTVVTLSAMSFDNPLCRMGDINVYVAAKTYSNAESCHAAILHYWIDLVSLSQ